MSGNLTPPPERAFPAGRLQLRKEQLVSHIHAEQQPRIVPLRRRRFALGATALAATACVAAAVVLFGAGGAGPSPAAAAVLRHAAQTAAQQPATAPPASGQFVYTKSEGSSGTTSVLADGVAINFVQRVTREAWIGPDGSGRLREVASPGQFAAPADRAAWIAAGKPDVLGGSSSDENFRAGGLHYVDLTGVPTDPTELRRQIEDRTVEGGPAGDAETFTIIGDLLRETYAPPGVRAALFTIASQLPGVQLVGTVKDELGRSGTAVAYVSHGVNNELIFDPQSSALLAERELSTGDGSWAPVGTVLASISYVSSGVVDSTSDTASTNP